MGEFISLSIEGTQRVGAWLAKPDGEARGGMVVIHEIYGITPHIRDVTERFAAEGYAAIAPAFFDHLEADVDLAYDRGGTNHGKALATHLGLELPVADVAAAAAVVGQFGKVGTVGFCWGGTLALLAAQQLGLPSVSYYGARNLGFLDQPLQAPVMFHFGEDDASITSVAIAAHRDKLPEMPVFTYPGAGHAFNRDVAGDRHYHAASARLAWQRTLAFFATNLRGAAPAE